MRGSRAGILAGSEPNAAVISKPYPTPRNLKTLMTLALGAGLLLVYLEARGLWTPDRDWRDLTSGAGLTTILLYSLIFVLGVASLVGTIWRPDSVRSITARPASIPASRWAAASVLLGVLAWTHLFSPWQGAVLGPWTQLLFALGSARLLAWLFEPGEGRPFGWNEIGLALVIFLYPRMLQEARVIHPSPLTPAVLIPAGMAAILVLIALLYLPVGEPLRRRLIDLRGRVGKYRPVLAALILLAPLGYRYALGAGGYILYPNFRFAVILAALWAAAFFLSASGERLFSGRAMLLSAGWLVLISALTRLLLLVVNDPFSLSWSEGNRFYDYSLVFGQSLYNYRGVITDPYGTPGRYGLWGVLFLWQGLPIWVHRLWNVVLLTAPSLLLAWALTRKLASGGLKWVVFLWIAAFFIILAPLHPPFMITAIIVALFAFHPSPYVRGGSLVAASLYAGLSRWTWVFAPAAWGALADLLLYYPHRTGSWLRRLLPAVLMALLGLLPGLILARGNFVEYSTGELGTANQPLLWYRLLPNPTLGPGVLLLLLLTTAPLIGLLIYMLASGRWKWDIFQHLAVWAALGGFLAAGLVISAKIGGGGDLHNTDLFIMTLVFVTIFALAAGRDALEVRTWSAWALALLCFMLFLPAYQFTPFYSSAGYNQWLDRPSQADMTAALSKIRTAVDQYSQRGEVLFMDQRQLLTFGYVKPVPFIPEYEKKYMMDQALASNEAYFQPYYRDLAARRFALIVTEPLKVTLKGQTGVFSDENDLWVTWVSKPTLCFYEPAWTDKSVGVQMLVPRQSPTGCEKYLNGTQP